MRIRRKRVTWADLSSDACESDSDNTSVSDFRHSSLLLKSNFFQSPSFSSSSPSFKSKFSQSPSFSSSSPSLKSKFFQSYRGKVAAPPRLPKSFSCLNLKSLVNSSGGRVLTPEPLLLRLNTPQSCEEEEIQTEDKYYDITEIGSISPGDPSHSTSTNFEVEDLDSESDVYESIDSLDSFWEEESIHEYEEIQYLDLESSFLVSSLGGAVENKLYFESQTPCGALPDSGLKFEPLVVSTPKGRSYFRPKGDRPNKGRPCTKRGLWESVVDSDDEEKNKTSRSYIKSVEKYIKNITYKKTRTTVSQDMLT